MKSKTQANPLRHSEIIAQKDEQIEAAKFDFFMFKQTLLDLFDEVKGNHSRIGNINGRRNSAGGMNIDPAVIEKVTDAEQKLEKVESHFEWITADLQEQLEKSSKHHKLEKSQKAQKTELAKSLKDIELTYAKNKQRLERDLNKMENQIN